MTQGFFDPDRYKWREVTGGPELSHKVRHDCTIEGLLADWQENS